MLFLPSLSSDHWDYHPHPHVHPVEFENLQEANFTELQSVQALHAPSLIRHDAIRYDAENLLDPNLGAHPHVLQQPVSHFITQQKHTLKELIVHHMGACSCTQQTQIQI